MHRCEKVQQFVIEIITPLREITCHMQRHLSPGSSDVSAFTVSVGINEINTWLKCIHCQETKIAILRQHHQSTEPLHTRFQKSFVNIGTSLSNLGLGLVLKEPSTDSPARLRKRIPYRISTHILHILAHASQV